MENNNRPPIKTLRVQDLVKIFGKRRVVNSVSVQVTKGEVVGLLGPNGAGKTTTFHMFTGMIKPTAGKVYLNDQEITRLPMYKRANGSRLPFAGAVGFS
jgi:lipopolysaccharide export system ATP-binding protein